MEKDFFDVFPHLKVKKELEELLDMVFVTKVSMNPGRTHLRVYIESSRWIHKKNIFALEDEIERQCFPGIPMTVTVVEKFHLSEQYTPENFLESYRSSMEMELRNYNMLEYNLFRRSKIIFTGKDTLRMELPDTVISRQKSEILVEYFHKVFCERCGMDLKVELDFVEVKESKYRKNAALQIKQEVENVLKHAKLSGDQEREPKQEDAAKEETKKNSGDNKGETRRNPLTKNSRRFRREISAAASDSAGTAIRMWFTAEILMEKRFRWRVLPVRWVRLSSDVRLWMWKLVRSEMKKRS